jgi:hypothetical protein
VTAASGARRASIQRDDALAYVAGYMDGRKNAERNTGHVAWRSQPRLQGIYDEGYEQAVEDARLDKLIAELGLGDDSHAVEPEEPPCSHCDMPLDEHGYCTEVGCPMMGKTDDGRGTYVHDHAAALGAEVGRR